MLDELRRTFEADPRIAYALLFGSRARGTGHGASDTDLAVGLVPGARLSAADVGDLVSRLETAVAGAVDIVLLDEAGPSLAYRVFREGQVAFERDRRALVERKARAILEYLDFRPLEETFARKALEAARRG